MSDVKVTINGKEYSIRQAKASEIVELFDLNPKRLIVEYNGHTLSYSDFERIKIRNGDVIEILAVA